MTPTALEPITEQGGSMRGNPTWPDWRQATAGTRVAHVRTGRTGTFIGVVVRPRHSYSTVDWDDVGFGITRGRVIAPAYDLRPTASKGES